MHSQIPFGDTFPQDEKLSRTQKAQDNYLLQRSRFSDADTLHVYSIPLMLKPFFPAASFEQKAPGLIDVSMNSLPFKSVTVAGNILAGPVSKGLYGFNTVPGHLAHRPTPLFFAFWASFNSRSLNLPF
ncbi:MAG: hypothetical protein ACO3IA_06280 [Candidatus Nanopelagicales bacterium]